MAQQNQELEEFKLLRQQASQKNVANQQMANDAIKRRFAAQGGLNSGAFMKTNERVGQQLRAEDQNAQQQINVAEMQERQRRSERAEEIGMQKDQFNKSFGLQEAQFKTANQQFDKNFGFQKEMATKDSAFKDKVFSFEKDSKLKQLDLAERQFALDRDAQEFNKQLAMIEAGKQPGGPLDSILGGKGNLPGFIANPTGAILNPLTGMIDPKGKLAPIVNPVGAISNQIVKKFKF